jgi:hypothetical protein
MDGATLSDHNVGHDVEAQRRDYTHALLSEVRLLVRTISNDPTKRVSDLKLSYTLPGTPGPKELTAPEIINAISEIEEHAGQQLGIARIGFLQLVRDALVSLTAPATGLTISYTTLVAGDQRSQSAESALALARKAYPLLGDRAVRHRRVASFLTVVAIVFTLFAAWEATKASLGKSLLQNLDLLRTQQAAIAAEKLKLETSLDRPAGDADLHIPADGRIPLQAVPLCDRYQLRGLAMPNMPEILKSLRLEASPAERELCGRDTVLVRNLEIVHFSLQQYQEFWPASVGGVVAAAGKFFSIFNPLQHAISGPTCRTASAAASEAVQPGGEPAKDQNNRSATCDDVEFMIAPMLQITTNYILPITFGFVGSLLYVLLDHFTKLRANTLGPRDFPLMILRLVIGLVVAACVSLLVSSSATSGAAIQGSASGLPATGTLLASLTLSASGITFLAGFGAEAVVILLQSLVTHLFATQK